MKTKRNKHLYPDSTRFLDWAKTQLTQARLSEINKDYDGDTLPTKRDPFHFGSFGNYKPDLVVSLPKNRDGSTPKDLVVQPSLPFIIFAPGFDEATEKVIRDNILRLRNSPTWARSSLSGIYPVKKLTLEEIRRDSIIQSNLCKKVSDSFNVWASKRSKFEHAKIVASGSLDKIKHTENDTLEVQPPDGWIKVNGQCIPFGEIGINKTDDFFNKYAGCQLRELIKKYPDAPTESLTVTLPKQTTGKMLNTSHGIHPIRSGPLSVGEFAAYFGNTTMPDCKTTINFYAIQKLMESKKE